jgi:2-keto-4-pentenoate hydratase/2-oxohepta-3-ene-1,7-dioic acid hydratase in catechol pathway
MTVDRDKYGCIAQLGMRLANLRKDGSYVLGAETERGILDVPATAAALGLLAPQDVDELLQHGLGAQVRVVADAAARQPDAAVVMRAPAMFAPLMTRPGKILCVGFNYQKHAEETNTKVGDVPPLFAKFRNALNHDGGTVYLPTKVASWFDYETELVIVFGRECHNVSEDDALDCVAGYAVGNDVSARDLQTATPQLTAGKISDGFAPIGPWLVPAGRVPDPNNLRLQTHVNGESRQDWNTNDMIFNCRRLISFVSGILPMQPGDVLFTGTPQGVILGQPEPPEKRQWLKAGDVVVSEIEGLGSLTVTLA